jgi:MFS family permease
MATGRLVGDRLIHLFGVYRLLLANGILMSAGFLIAALFPFVFSAAFGFLLIGAGSSILVPVVYLLAAKSKKMSPGYALSSVTLIGYTGFLIGPLLIGNISEKLGMNYAFFLLCGVSLLIVVLSLQVKKFA